MTLPRNPYKDEYTRRTLQHAMGASDARNKVRGELQALSQVQQEKAARRDVDVVEFMLALIDHVSARDSGAGSTGFLSSVLTYKDAKWLVDVTLAACKVSAQVREEASKMVAKGAPGSVFSRTMGAGAFVADKADTATTLLSCVANPIVQTVGPLVYNAVQSILLANPPVGLSPVLSAKASALVVHVLGFLGNVGSHIAVTLLSKASVFAILVVPLHALSMQERLGQMQALHQRYQGYCSCCDVIEKIYLGWMSGATGRCIDAIPIAGAVHVATSIGMKIGHRIHKKMNPSSHRTPYHLATELWQAARRRGERGAKPCMGGNQNGPLEWQLLPNDRCPLALLAIATLFGGGDSAKGVRKAAAAVMAEQEEAVKKIKGFIASGADNALENVMTRFKWGT